MGRPKAAVSFENSFAFAAPHISRFSRVSTIDRFRTPTAGHSQATFFLRGAQERRHEYFAAWILSSLHRLCRCCLPSIIGGSACSTLVEGLCLSFVSDMSRLQSDASERPWERIAFHGCEVTLATHRTSLNTPVSDITCCSGAFRKLCVHRRRRAWAAWPGRPGSCQESKYEPALITAFIAIVGAKICQTIGHTP